MVPGTLGRSKKIAVRRCAPLILFTVQPGAAEGRLRRPKAAFVFPLYTGFRLIHRINPQEDSQRVILEIHPQLSHC